MNATSVKMTAGLLGALLLGVSSAQAVLSINGGSQPLTDVQISQPNHSINNSITWRNSTSDGLRNVGQSFLVDDTFNMEALSIYVNQTPGVNGLRGASVSLSIIEIANSGSSAAAGNPGSGTLLYKESGTFASDFSINGAGENSWLTFSFGSAVTLLANHSYAWILSFDDAAANRGITVAFLNGNPYADGFAWASTDGTTYSLLNGVNADMTFAIQGAAIPEPATAALVLLGGAFAVVLRKRVLKGKASK